MLNFSEFEPKWRTRWEDEKIYSTRDDENLDKQYILDMFPYPSGLGLHVGHVESYTATDIYSRYLRMNGKDVLHPQGWDAFGLPAENYAIKTGIHPTETTKTAIENFKKQIASLGFSYDWSREVNSSTPEYYKWTQWIFLELYKNGLAYKKKAKVNWCEHCQTVLANEQAETGRCERCDSEVVQKELEQWFFKITDFIEDQGEVKGLLSGLDTIDWPESTKAAQRNWIGRSVGASVKFQITSTKNQTNSNDQNLNNEILEVFTTRPDTLFGATYMVVAPEHRIIEDFRLQIENLEEVKKYVDGAINKTDLERQEEKEKTGVELKGLKAVNPVNDKELPIFVADYVLGGYGTGAIMAVPAHDERDWEFALKYNIKIKPVVDPVSIENVKNNYFPKYLPLLEENKPFEQSEEKFLNQILLKIKQGKEYGFSGEGVNFDSDFLNDLKTSEAKKKIIEWLEDKGLGEGKTTYRLRDWLVSRQRYWGAPIPIIYCDKCGEVPVPVEDLPVKLPTDVDFKPTGESPLKYSESFQKVKCPKCGSDARRESDTMDTFVCSSWYYLRYSDNQNKNEFASKENLKKWLPVDVYVGGAEHTVLHLLYSRFFTKALQKLGHLDFNEPFTKMRHQGLIMAEDGTKMSKSKGNVVNPDDVVKEFGADSLRMYEMFMGPLEDMKPWNTKGIIGIQRFLEKVFKLESRIMNQESRKDNSPFEGGEPVAPARGVSSTDKELHKTIKKVGEDIQDFKFNTAISQMMILVNEMLKEKEILKSDYEILLKLLAPFAPFTAEEQWSKISNEFSIHKTEWPQYDEGKLAAEEINLSVQVNGKFRGVVTVPVDAGEETVLAVVKKSEIQDKYLSDGYKKFILVKNKIVNFIV